MGESEIQDFAIRFLYDVQNSRFFVTVPIVEHSEAERNHFCAIVIGDES